MSFHINKTYTFNSVAISRVVMTPLAQILKHNIGIDEFYVTKPQYKMWEKKGKKKKGKSQTIFIAVSKDLWKGVRHMQLYNEFVGSGKRVFRPAAGGCLRLMLHEIICDTTELFAGVCSCCLSRLGSYNIHLTRNLILEAFGLSLPWPNALLHNIPINNLLRYDEINGITYRIYHLFSHRVKIDKSPVTFFTNCCYGDGDITIVCNNI